MPRGTAPRRMTWRCSAPKLCNTRSLPRRSAPSLTVPFLSPEKTVRYDNHNRLLQLYSDCTGIKTGFTKKAGRCLVSSAERGGAQLICVTLNAPDDWNDHIALFEYGFSQLETRAITPDGTLYAVPVVGGAASSVVCRAEGEASATLYRDAALTASVSLPRFVYAPLEAGAQVGCVTYSVNGSVVAELPIVAAADVQPAEDTRSDFQKGRPLRRPSKGWIAARLLAARFRKRAERAAHRNNGLW